MREKSLIFAFDIGYKFHGWAVNRNFDKTEGMSAGVYGFEIPEDKKTVENEIKREKRRRARNKERRRKVSELITKTGIAQSQKDFLDRVNQTHTHSFWQILKTAHYQPILPFDFARILYKFSKNRYYVDMRKKKRNNREKDAQEGKIKTVFNAIEQFKEFNETWFEAFLKYREDIKKEVSNKLQLQNFPYRNKKLLKDNKKITIKDFSISPDYYQFLNNEMMVESIEEIARRQREDFKQNHPIFSKEIIDKWKKIVTDKGHLQNSLKMVGKCLSGNNKIRAPKNSIDAERVRIAELWNDLGLCEKDAKQTIKAKDLGISFDEFNALLLKLLEHSQDSENGKITGKQFIEKLKELSLLENDKTYFITKHFGQKDKANATLISLKGHSQLAKVENETFKQKFLSNVEFRDKIETELMTEKNLDRLEGNLIKIISEYFKIGDTNLRNLIQKISNFESGKPSGYSAEALRNILPYIANDNKSFKEAIELSYPSSVISKNELRTYLSFELYQEENRYRNIKNPYQDAIVKNFVYIFNKLVQKFGHPDQIVFETTRAILSPDETEAEIVKINDNIKANEKIDEILKQYDLKNEKGTKERIRLWLEQGGKLNKDTQTPAICVITGDTISLQEALNGQKTNIDHIIPQSIINDNRMVNKILLSANLNQSDKSDLTPFNYLKEKLGKSTKEAKKFLEKNIKKIKSDKPFTMSSLKKRNILLSIPMDDLKKSIEDGLDGMDQRMYGVTNASVKMIMNLLKNQLHLNRPQLSKEQIASKILPIAGGVTSQFRRAWLKKYKKDRNFYDNHAVDAMILLNFDRSMLQKYATKKKKGILDGKEGKDPREIIQEFKPTIENFQERVLQIVDQFRNNKLFVHWQETKRFPKARITEQTSYKKKDALAGSCLTKKGHIKCHSGGFSKIELYEENLNEKKKLVGVRLHPFIMQNAKIKQPKDSEKLFVLYRNSIIKFEDEFYRVIGFSEDKNGAQKFEFDFVNKNKDKRIIKSFKTKNIKKCSINPFGKIKIM